MSWIIYTQQPLALQCNYNMEKSVSHPDKSNIFLMCFRFWLFDSYSTQNCMRELIAHYSLWVSVQNCARAGTQHRRRGVATSDWLNTLDYLAWAGQLDPTLHNILLGRADPCVQLLDRQYDAKVVYDSLIQWHNKKSFSLLCFSYSFSATQLCSREMRGFTTGQSLIVVFNPWDIACGCCGIDKASQ